MLTEQQINIAKEFAIGTLSVNQIAEKNEVSRTTLWQWRQIPEFKELMDTYSKEILAMTRSEIKLHSNQYLQKLNKLTDSKNEKVRLEALKTLMAMAGISSEMTTKLELSMPEPTRQEKLTVEELRQYAVKNQEEEG